MRVAVRRPEPNGDNVRPPSVTLLAGNSLLRDVNEDTSTGGNDNSITVRKKSGATLNDLGEMIDEVCRADNFDLSQIVIVGGTRGIMGNVPAQEIQENVSRLLQKRKTVTRR